MVIKQSSKSLLIVALWVLMGSVIVVNVKALFLPPKPPDINKQTDLRRNFPNLEEHFCQASSGVSLHLCCVGVPGVASVPM